MPNLILKRVVMEVFGGCNYTCQMCPQTSPGRGSSFTRKMPLDQFKNILDQIIPKYGSPQINLEGSGEPTMAKDLYLYIDEVKKRNLPINVQYYISNSKLTLKELNFDTTNTITVLTKQSSKGLEFDCVFVPSLNDIEYSDQGFLYSMDLYVVFHRVT